MSQESKEQNLQNFNCGVRWGRRRINSVVEKEFWIKEEENSLGIKSALGQILISILFQVEKFPVAHVH